MIVAFLYGMFTAWIGLAVVLIYGFTKVKEGAAKKAQDTAARIQSDASLVAQAAKLDPIRQVSTARLCFGRLGEKATAAAGDPGARTPSSSQADAPEGSSSSGSGVSWSDWVDSRAVLLGTTITLYELLEPNAGYSQNTSTTGGAASASDVPGSGASATATSSSVSSGFPSSSSTSTAERFIGKISTSLISHRSVSIDELVFMFADPLTLATTRALGGTHPGAAAMQSAATRLFHALYPQTAGYNAPVNERNAEDWLKDHVQGRALMLEYSSPTPDEGNGSASTIFVHNHRVAAGSSISTGHRGVPTSATSLYRTESVTSLLILFGTRRDEDRWSTILSANERTFEWKQYVRTLPSLDVVNLLLARVFFENTSGSALTEFIREKIERKVRAVVFPKSLSGHIEVLRVTAGGEVPLLHNVSFASFSTNGEIGFDFDVQYRGGFQVDFAASMMVKSIQLPQILFHVRLVEIGGRLHVSIGPPPANQFWLGFHETPNVRIEFSQELASHEGVLSSLLSWIPDLSDTITNIVKVEVFEEMLLPNMDCYELPRIEPSSSNANANAATSSSSATFAGAGDVPHIDGAAPRPAQPHPSNSQIHSSSSRRGSGTSNASSVAATNRLPSLAVAPPTSAQPSPVRKPPPSLINASDVLHLPEDRPRSAQQQLQPRDVTPQRSGESAGGVGHRREGSSSGGGESASVSTAAASASAAVADLPPARSPSRLSEAPTSSPASSLLKQFGDVRSALQAKGATVRKVAAAVPPPSATNAGNFPLVDHSDVPHNESAKFQQPQWGSPTF